MPFAWSNTHHLSLEQNGVHHSRHRERAQGTQGSIPPCCEPVAIWEHQLIEWRHFRRNASCEFFPKSSVPSERFASAHVQIEGHGRPSLGRSFRPQKSAPGCGSRSGISVTRVGWARSSIKEPKSAAGQCQDLSLIHI